MQEKQKNSFSRMLSSWWILLTFGAFVTNWIAFLYIGIRARKPSWALWSIFYFSPIILFFIIGRNEQISDSFVLGVAFFVAISAILGIIHAFLVRKAYLIRINAYEERKRQIMSEIIEQDKIKLNSRDAKNIIRRQITSAYGAAIISAAVTTIMAILPFFGITIIKGDLNHLYLLVDAVIILGLAFGVYKKSRTCAVILFVYFLLSKVFLFMDTNASKLTTGSIAMSALFIYMYWQGIIGTFAYHKYIEKYGDQTGFEIRTKDIWKSQDYSIGSQHINHFSDKSNHEQHKSNAEDDAGRTRIHRMMQDENLTKSCQKCGMALHETNQVCWKCGTEVSNQDIVEKIQ